MSNYPKLTNYVSEMDQLLQAFDEKHPTLSLSQLKEKEKYQRIYYLRDVSERPIQQSQKIWGNF